jgi:hypothetical protein
MTLFHPGERSGRYCNAFQFREECAAKRLGPTRAPSHKGGYT